MSHPEKDTDLIEEIISEGRGKPTKQEPLVTPRRSSPVVIYLVILFAAAFLLLLMAYFMQQRNSETVIDNLQNSVDRFQTLDEMRAENIQLRQELTELELQLSDLEDRLAQAEISLEAAKTAAEQTKAVAIDAQQRLEGHIILLTWYSQLEEALRTEDLDQAASLYHSIMQNYGYGGALNQFAYDLGLVDVDGNVVLDLEARMAEIAAQLGLDYGIIAVPD